MISEVTFSYRFNTLWNSLTPTMNHFVRNLNLNLYERYDNPVETETSSKIRSLISEAAFLGFTHYINKSNKKDINQIFSDHYFELFHNAHKRVFHLIGNENFEDFITSREIEESQALSHNIISFFKNIKNNLVIKPEPHFNGAGFIDYCIGDIACNDTLVELKTVNRNFRATDVRQLLTYCALDYANQNRWIHRCCLLNPRKGIYWEDSVSKLCRLASGYEPEIFFRDILYAVSSGELSR